MPTIDNDTTGSPTISVATMSAISIDLEAGVATLPRQNRPGDGTGESAPL
ncbi:hypothetical protein KIH74_16615 [Kineosporia sp. J2-2]|uniref:Uncharacterized protein n=1 Tax=Kineosporia corallincola TaxID=2835133 RepID=A0ABS5THK4_9ACTN|nr:hypothetical protein [Kineosporia corallincola]MBT0770568.1 hypothetical protein [Kineosporia corallincola]